MKDGEKSGSKQQASDALWQALQAIRSFQFTAQSSWGSSMDWNGRGAGRVDVENRDAEIIFKETGKYTTRQGNVFQVSNRYAWKRESTLIALSRRRFQAMVLLVNLEPLSLSTWQSMEAHLCGKDRYQLKLHRHPDGIETFWVIRGPTKNESLHYRYRFA